ncbi:hypothetical protein Tco_1296254 [Tanacetum coccineum]
MSSLASFLLCSCLLAPRRENTLVEREDACDVDLLPRPLLSSDPKRENTLLDQAEDGIFGFLSVFHLSSFSFGDNSRMANGVTELVGKSHRTSSSILTMLRTDPSTLGVSFTAGLMFLGRSCVCVPRMVPLDDTEVERSGIKEHPTCFNRIEEYVDCVSDDGSAAYDHRLQFLEEKNEKNLSWRLLKLSRGDKVRSTLELYAFIDFMGLRLELHAFNALLSCLLRNDELDGVAKARGSEEAFGLFEELVSDDEHKKKVDQVVTMSTKEHEKRHRSRRSRSPRPSLSVFSRIRRDRSRLPNQNWREKEGGVFKMLGSRGRSVSARSASHNPRSYSSYTEALSESEDSEGGHWKSRSKKKKSSREEDDLSQSWVCEEIDPFTPRIRYFDFPKTRMPSHIKTYDGSEDPDDHLKIF